jgi:hypothetical protein
MPVSRDPNGLHVTTLNQRYAYAMMSSKITAPADGVYYFSLQYQLIRGGIAFGALSEDRSRWIEQAGNATNLSGNELTKGVRVKLHAGESIWLIVTNNYPGGDGVSELVMEQVGVSVLDATP